MEVKRTESYLHHYTISITNDGQPILNAYLCEADISSECHDGVYIRHAITIPGYRLFIHYDGDYISMSYYNSEINNKFNVLYMFAKSITKNMTISPEDEMYSMIMDARQFLTYKLKCILNVMTKDYIASISDVDIHGFANEIIDIFDSSLTKSARK